MPYFRFLNILIASLLIAAGIFLFLRTPPQNSGSPRPAAPLAVRVLEFGEQQGGNTLEFSGTLQEHRLAPIAFEVGGRVIAIAVRDGDTLMPGAPIAVLDSTTFTEAHRLNTAKQRQAQDAYDRLKILRDSGAVTEMQWVEMETGLAQANALAGISRKQLQDTRLRAPVRGIVIHRNLEVGQSVLPGFPVLSLLDPDYLDAVFSVAETEILHVHVGQSMAISLPGNAGETLEGTVNAIAIQPDPVSRHYAIRVRLDNHRGRLRMGMACQGKLVLQDSAARAVLPVQAILEKPDGTRYVYVAENGVARMREVHIDGFLGKGLRVLSGLEHGELVVIEGTHGLTDGLPVSF